MKTKRFLSLLLALTLTVGLLPLSAASAELDSSIEAEPDSSLTEPVSAPPEAAEPEAAAPAVRTPATKAVTASGTCGENLTWTLTDDGTLTVSGTGDMTDYSSESSVPWYSNRSGIKKAVIENGVTSIGDAAFYWCTSLTSITIPASVTSIGGGAFEHCTSLTSITIPDSVTSIGDWAFYYCTNLTDITIPDSVTSIGGYAFCNCTSLTGIYVDDSNPTYADIDGVLYNKNITELISYPNGYGSSYIIPDSVTSIGDYAFCRCTSLTSITIPASITSIGDYAFSGCDSLTSITIPDSVTSIGDGAFSNCDSLTGITIPDSVTSIGNSAFYNCDSLTGITIPDSVTSIGDRAFYDCTSLTNVTIGNSVTSIGNFAFSNCTSLTGITFKGMVPPTIGSGAFYRVTATAYYPGGELWTEDVRQNYSGTLTWVEYTPEDNYEIVDGKIYYYGENGELAEDGKHNFSDDGYITGNNVFITVNNNTYYIVNNTIVTNYYIIDNRVYYFGDDGVQTEDGKHDFSEDGYITGNNVFITINNNTYYIVNNTIVTNYYIIDNRVYYFGEDGALSDDGKHDFSEDGYITGNNVFITINNNTYYIVNNTIVTNYYIIDNRVYYFGDDGVQTEDGKHQFSPDGYITGSNIFITVNNNTYYIVNNTIITNYYIIDNRIYYFGSDGAMTQDGKHTFSPNGYITGSNIFITINNNTYYIVNNTIVINYYIIDNRIYYFGSDGAMTGDGKHQFSPDGYILGDRIFVTVNNIKFYLINNVIAVPVAVILTNLPAKLHYAKGQDALDVTGGCVTVCFENDIQESFDLAESMVTGFDNTKAGKQTLTVNYCGKTVTYDVEIFIPGDADSNEAINVLDVMTIINIITGVLQPTDSLYARADLNGDGTVNILDAMTLINQITGA